MSVGLSPSSVPIPPRRNGNFLNPRASFQRASAPTPTLPPTPAPMPRLSPGPGPEPHPPSFGSPEPALGPAPAPNLLPIDFPAPPDLPGGGGEVSKSSKDDGTVGLILVLSVVAIIVIGMAISWYFVYWRRRHNRRALNLINEDLYNTRGRGICGAGRNSTYGNDESFHSASSESEIGDLKRASALQRERGISLPPMSAALHSPPDKGVATAGNFGGEREATLAEWVKRRDALTVGNASPLPSWMSQREFGNPLCDDEEASVEVERGQKVPLPKWTTSQDKGGGDTQSDVPRRGKVDVGGADERGGLPSRIAGINLRDSGGDSGDEGADTPEKSPLAGANSGDGETRDSSTFARMFGRGWGRNRPTIFPGARVFSYREIQEATLNFTACVGEGSFGQVFRGELHSGEIVAVKVLTNSSKQGDSEFRNEVSLLGRLHHRNLVNLVGYCTERGKRMLVMEFMTNGSLERRLQDTEMAAIDWETRLCIAEEVAQGIEFLHDASPPVIHRDIKSANILLDSNLRARVADFGISVAAPQQPNVKINKKDAKGTYGYVDPEYVHSGKLSVKSDVYSFGILLFEIISARQPSHGLMDFVKLAKMGAADEGVGGWGLELLDSRLPLSTALQDGQTGPSSLFSLRQVQATAAIAAACTYRRPKKRPLMRDVAKALSLVRSGEGLGNIGRSRSACLSIAVPYGTTNPYEALKKSPSNNNLRNPTSPHKGLAAHKGPVLSRPASAGDILNATRERPTESVTRRASVVFDYRLSSVPSSPSSASKDFNPPSRHLP